PWPIAVEKARLTRGARTIQTGGLIFEWSADFSPQEDWLAKGILECCRLVCAVLTLLRDKSRAPFRSGARTSDRRKIDQQRGVWDVAGSSVRCSRSCGINPALHFGWERGLQTAGRLVSEGDFGMLRARLCGAHAPAG